MSINLKALIGKLNDTCRQAAERAASLCMGLLQAGASGKGEFESRLKNVIDEVKKHPQMFDKGAMDDAEGREMDSRNCLIILASNVGSPQIMQACLDRVAEQKIVETVLARMAEGGGVGSQASRSAWARTAISNTGSDERDLWKQRAAGSTPMPRAQARRRLASKCRPASIRNGMPQEMAGSGAWMF